MRRRTVAIAGFIIVAAIAMLLLAPVVYSPIRFLAGNGSDHYLVSVAAYESPSCALVGVGATVANRTYTSVLSAVGSLGPWSYYLACPPRILPLPHH